MGEGRRWDPCSVLVWMRKLVKNIRKKWNFLKTLKLKLQWESATSPLSTCSKEMACICQKDTCTCIAALFTIAKTWKQPKCSFTDGWEKLLRNIHHGILFSHKKDRLLPFVTAWMGLGGTIWNEIRQVQTETQILPGLTQAVWNLKALLSYKLRVK